MKQRHAMSVPRAIPCPGLGRSLGSVGAGMAAVLLLTAAPVLAADAPPAAPLDFEGLTEAALMASPLTADSIQCGLDLDRLVAVARQKLADGGLVLRDDAATRVTVSAVTVRVAGTEQCATTVLLGAYTQESFFSASAGWLRSGYVVIWQRALAVATPAGAHAAAVGAAVGRVTEQLLAAWHAQGQTQGRSDRMAAQDRVGDDK
jgi:hypothetical protein